MTHNKEKNAFQKIPPMVFYILLGIGLSIGLYTFDRLTNHLPIYQEEIKNVKPNSTYELDMHLKKSGCYEVGFSSDKGRIFAGHNLDGLYKLEFFSKDKLLEERNISIRRGTKYYSDTTYSKLILDSMESPLKGHRKIKVKLTVLRPEKIFDTLTDTNLYVYFDYAPDLICGEALEKYKEIQRIKKLTINSTESNETLIPLYEALMYKNLEKVKQIVESGTPVNVTMIGSRTPLHFSSYVNDVATSDYLVKQGADIEAIDIHQRTPLYYAIENNATDVTHLLIENNATLPELVGFTGGNPKLQSRGAPPFFYAVCSEMFEMADLLSIHKDVDIHQMYNNQNIYSHVKICVNQVVRNASQQPIYEAKVTKIRKYLDKYGMTYKQRYHQIQFDKETR